VLVSEADHPFWDWWWPAGHDRLGAHFCPRARTSARLGVTKIAPHGTTFEDGYCAAVLCDAILRSAETGSQQRVSDGLPVEGQLSPL
jgi:predicted dehydrogenase